MSQGRQPGRDRGHLITERANPASTALDRMGTEQALALFSAADRDAVAAVEAARPQMARAVELITERLARGGRLFYVGAGTSGRLGVLDASECPPTFRSDPDQVQGVMAGGEQALTRAVEGAEDCAEAGAAAMDERALSTRDVVLGISAGGTTPFVHGALEQARMCGAATVFMACVPEEQVPCEADVSLRLVVGPELIAGSTRLKAGTATKVALNALSSLVMVRLGKVSGNLMVDLETGANAKLVERGERILMTLLELDRPRAGALLEAAGGRVKLAAVMHARDLGPEAAGQVLQAAGGDLRDAMSAERDEAQGRRR